MMDKAEKEHSWLIPHQACENISGICRQIAAASAQDDWIKSHLEWSSAFKMRNEGRWLAETQMIKGGLAFQV